MRLAITASIVVLLVVAVAAINPSNDSRDWTCPNYVVDTIPDGYVASIADLNKVRIDNTLVKSVPEMRLLNNSAVILIKRVLNSSTGQITPYFKYVGNGHENFAIETWSSSKIFSAMNGAGRLGMDCPEGGLAQATNGSYGETPLGDVVTIIVTYDTTHPPLSSNSLGGWFEMVGGRKRAVWLVKEWMGRVNESLGADYGATPPKDLGFTFCPGNCTIMPDTPDNGNNANTLSALTAAEFVKRIIFARELPNETFPNTTWLDSQTLLYGAQNSTLFPGRVWGGMSATSGNPLRWGLNMTEIEERSKGLWRTFGKDGAGYSYIRDAGEALINAYACYPDASDPGRGVEYIVSSRVAVPLDYHLTQASRDFYAAHLALNKAIFNRKLQ